MRVPKLLPGIFLLIGGLLCGFDERLLAANAGGLAGIVKDSRGAPLAGVAVTLLRGQFNPKVVQTVTTDGTGRFEMRELVPGFYSLKANLASYLPLIQSQVGVVAGKIADLTLILENLYLQSILGVSAGGLEEPVREDIESVLRSASSTRPILRVFDADAGSREEQEDRGIARNRNGIRGVVGFSTAAYSTAPDLASAGSTFTDFAFIKDVGSSTTWVVAGVISDSGFAELDSLLRFRSSDRHTTSARLSLGILPYVGTPLSPVADQNVRRLNMYNLDLQDELKISEMMSVIYGAELQMTDPSSNASRFRPRWGLRFRPSAGSQYSFLRTKSLPQMQRTLELSEGDDLELASPFQHDFGNRLNLGFNRVTHTEAESEQSLGTARFSAGVYTDQVASNYLSNTGAERLPESRGVRLSYRQLLGSAEGVIGYTYGSGLQSDQNLSEFAAHNVHVVAARIRSKLPLTHTQVAATYRWLSDDSITIVDPYQTVFESNSPGLSLAFVQAIPYFGKFIPGKMEAQLDVRNLFGRSNPELYQSANLRRVEFLQPARSVRGGIKLKF
jgi:hypothetical protein